MQVQTHAYIQLFIILIYNQILKIILYIKYKQYMLKQITNINQKGMKELYKFSTVVSDRSAPQKFQKLQPLFEKLTRIMDERPWPLVFRKHVNYDSNLVPSHNFPYNAFKKVTPELICKREPNLISTLNQLYRLLCEIDPSYQQVVRSTNHICLNKNLATIKHCDRHNVGRSMIFTLGNYAREKGKLYFDATQTQEAVEIDPFKNPTKINGKREHYNHIEEGKNRYSIVIFGHIRDDVDNYSQVLKTLSL